MFEMVGTIFNFLGALLIVGLIIIGGYLALLGLIHTLISILGFFEPLFTYVAKKREAERIRTEKKEREYEENIAHRKIARKKPRGEWSVAERAAMKGNWARMTTTVLIGGVGVLLVWACSIHAIEHMILTREHIATLAASGAFFFVSYLVYR